MEAEKERRKEEVTVGMEGKARTGLRPSETPVLLLVAAEAVSPLWCRMGYFPVKKACCWVGQLWLMERSQSHLYSSCLHSECKLGLFPSSAENPFISPRQLVGPLGSAGQCRLREVNLKAPGKPL